MYVKPPALTARAVSKYCNLAKGWRSIFPNTERTMPVHTQTAHTELKIIYLQKKYYYTKLFMCVNHLIPVSRKTLSIPMYCNPTDPL